jgi:hypothetical protein
MDGSFTVPPPPPPPQDPPDDNWGVAVPPAVSEPGPATVQPLPWEQPGYPPLEGLFETAKLFITSPSEAFARVRTTGGLGRPIAWAIIFGWIGVIAGQVYNLAFGGSWMRLLPNMPHSEEMAASGLMNMGFSIAFMVLAPIFILIGLFIWAAIVHLFLLLLGGANSGFDGTVRVLCYASTVQIAQVVPLCGGMVAGIAAIVLEIIGLAIIHRTTQGKAAGAVLIPVAICCVCAVALAVAFGAAIVALIAGAAGSH